MTERPPTDWRPVRPFTNFPPIEPQPFDTRDSTYIPDLSVADAKVTRLSSRKIRGVGMKMYSTANQSIPDSTNTEITYNTIAWQRGIDTPDGFPSSCEGFRLPHSGVWSITVSHYWDPGQGYVQGMVWLPEETLYLGYSGASTGTAVASTQGAYTLVCVELLDSGTLVQARAYQYNDGAANRLLIGGEYTLSLSAVLLFGV